MNSREEHLATRSAAGLFDFSFMGLFEFSGTAALDRLQSRRLAEIEPGRAAYTLLLNDDGSVFNDATVWNMGADRWWLFTGRPKDIAWLGAAARDLSGQHAILALQGPASGTILARLIGADTVRDLRYFHFVQRRDMLVARLGYSGELGYELMVPLTEEQRLRSRLLDAGGPHDLVECSFEAANSLRIESGYVLFDREIDGRANPRELGLDRLVSDVRRFEVTRKLVGLNILDYRQPPELPLAHLTSECFSPTLLMPIALGFVSPSMCIGDSARDSHGRAVRITQLPFYKPSCTLPRVQIND